MRNREYRDPEPAQRKCLMCSKLFNSRCKNERICTSCKNTELYKSGDNLVAGSVSVSTVRKKSE